LLQELTGTEAACVVNNCAGAVLLAVSVLAAGREVIISRGELVEIGGAFRMPDIIAASGAKLIEVGTTNKTRLSDYAHAIGENTGLILRCHPSNFAVVGFTESVPTSELAQLGRERGVPVMDDQGSGAILDLSPFGVSGWGGTLGDSVRAGCDVITASGDKLLGASQAGLILGKTEVIGRILKHPLARTLRIDKLSLTALEATLRLYRDPAVALREIPTLRAIARPLNEIHLEAQRFAEEMERVLPQHKFIVTLIPAQSQVGGGSLPGEDLPTTCVAIISRSKQLSPHALAASLRQWTPAIFARIHHDAVLFDPRTLEANEFTVIAAALQAVAEK
jgi:L-seryl-tRNA(Ser) seleniumtransferase